MTPTSENLILEKLEELNTRQKLMHTKLFGDENEETEHGRIPRMERKIADDNERLHALEKTAAEKRGGSKLIAQAVVGVGLLLGMLEIAAIWIRH